MPLPLAGRSLRRQASSSLVAAQVSARCAIVTVRFTDVVRRSLLASVDGAGVCAGHLETRGRRAAFDDRRADAGEYSLHAIAGRAVCVGCSRDSVGRHRVFSARRDDVGRWLDAGRSRRVRVVGS